MNTRQQDIVTLVQQYGEITIRDLAERLGVSEMTIHRDLDFLQGERYLYKKRGAAVFVECADRTTDGFYAQEKRAIGKAAAAMIAPGQSILFDNSTTAIECARFLDRSARYTFYCTGIESAALLTEFPNSVLYCSGGYFFPESRGFVGTQVADFLKNVQADICILGASGISITRGLTTPYPMHAPIQRAIMAACEKRLLLADHSKFGKAAMETYAQLSEVDAIITDCGISSELLAQYQAITTIITA